MSSLKYKPKRLIYSIILPRSLLQLTIFQISTFSISSECLIFQNVSKSSTTFIMYKQKGVIILDSNYPTAPFSFCFSIPILPLMLELLSLDPDNFLTRSLILVILSSLLRGYTCTMIATSSLMIILIYF